MASTVKPGTKHPSKPGLVMGTKGRYVAKSTYAKQVKAGNQPPAKTTPKVTAAKTTPTKPATSSRPEVGATKRLQGRMVRWNGKRWTAAGTGPKLSAPTPRKADATPKPQTTPTANTTSTPKPNVGQRLTNAAKNVKLPKIKLPAGAGKLAGGAGRLAGGVGLAAAAGSTIKDLKEQIFDRQEGFGSFGRLAKALAEDNKKANQGSRGRSQDKKDNANKPKTESKPSRVTSRQETNRRGRPITSSSSKPSSSSKSSSDKPKYPTTAVTKTIKKSRDYQAEAKAKAAGSKPKRKPSIKEAAYAKDSRNKEYDRLRNAGKTKEAEALGRVIAGMPPKEVKKTQTRTGGSRIANITLPKKSNQKQSAANKAGWQGNRNY